MKSLTVCVVEAEPHPVKMVIKRKSVQLAGTAPTFNVKPAIQVALVRPDNPDDWAVIGNPSPFVGAGENNTGVLDVSATTAGKFFVRFGVQYYLGGTAPTDGQADVEVQVSYVSCGSIVGMMTQELQAFNTTTDSYVAITGWVPCCRRPIPAGIRRVALMAAIHPGEPRGCAPSWPASTRNMRYFDRSRASFRR